MGKHLLPARISFAIVGTCALLAIGVAVAERALARPLNFVLCEHKTGEPADESLALSGIETVGPRVIRSENVWAVVHTAEDKCSIIMLNQGHAAVVGSYSEVYCRVYGGEGCK